MGPPSHLVIPDVSVKNLISKRRSSSSPTSLTESPTTEPSFSPSSHSEFSGQGSNRQSDVTLSSASSSFSLVREIAPIVEHKGLRWRGKKKKDPVSKKSHKRSDNLDMPTEERCKHLTQRRGSAVSEKKGKGCLDNACCKCMAGFTVDCAAVCCCPLALLNLAALTFIRLPTSVAWKILVNLKNNIYSKRQQGRPSRDAEEESPRPKFNSPLSNGSSPVADVDLGSYRAKFDRQNLWQHFETGRLDFGALSMTRDNGDASSIKNG